MQQRIRTSYFLYVEFSHFSRQLLTLEFSEMRERNLQNEKIIRSFIHTVEQFRLRNINDDGRRAANHNCLVQKLAGKYCLISSKYLPL